MTDTDYHRTYYQRNRERLIEEQRQRTERKNKESPAALPAYRKAYYEANKERLLPEQRARGKKNYEANPSPYKARNRRSLLKKYGLTEDEFQDMLDEQGGSCAICAISRYSRRMVVDHCHKTGAVRGILCSVCNTALGLLGDYPDRIMEAADYLIKSSCGATSTTSSEP